MLLSKMLLNDTDAITKFERSAPLSAYARATRSPLSAYACATRSPVLTYHALVYQLPLATARGDRHVHCGDGVDDPRSGAVDGRGWHCYGVPAAAA
eukprot:2201512-Rhodomonas_salina.1